MKLKNLCFRLNAHLHALLASAFTALVLITFVAPSARAEILTTAQGKDTLEGVMLANQATTSQGAKLFFAGAGLRAKKVVLVNVNVYVAQLFAAEPTKLAKTGDVLGSLSAAQPLALQMQFLRDVDAAKVQSSFKEALEANKINVEKPEIQKVLTAVKSGGEAKKGKTLTLVAVKNPDGTESVTYEDANKKAVTVNGPAGFMKDIFSIWLGTPSDDGVARLKASLLK